MFDVIVIGNVGVDTNVFVPGADIDFEVEANFTENIDTVGQAGGFAARGYAQLGYKTAFVGHVGDDAAGEMVRAAFAGDGIDTRALLVDPAGTARSVNMMFRDGRRKNFYDGKGHMTLPPPLKEATPLFTGAKLFHFNLANWGRQLLPLARAAGGTIACDLQDVVDPADPYRRDFIAAADILFFSAANHPDPAPLIQTFLNRGSATLVVCGMGSQGVAVGTAAGVSFYPPPPLTTPILDTNGAGDGLAVGTLSSYILEQLPLATALLRGQIVARHTCTQRASSATLIRKEALDRLARQLGGG